MLSRLAYCYPVTLNENKKMADEKVVTLSDKDMAELKSQYNEIEKNLGTKTADLVAAKVKEAVEPVQSELSKYKADAEKNQKALDEMIAKQGKIEMTPAADITKAFEDQKEKFKSYKETKKGFGFELKTVGNIGANSNITVSGTPDFQHGGMVWGPGRKAFAKTHIRDLCMVMPIADGADFYVVRDSGGEGGPTSVAHSAVKPQSDRDWVKTVVPITKIAHYYKVPEEYLADIPWMQTEITGVGVEELMAKEDTLFLTNSAAGEFKGLNQTFNSTAYSTPSELADIFTGANRAANRYDVLVAAITQLAKLNKTASGILVAPADFAKLLLTKDLNNNYVFGPPNVALPNVLGVAIHMHTAVTADKFFVGDFTKVKIPVKAGLSVRFYDQNESDAIYNLVTVVIEERVSIAADRDDSIIYGDFSDAETELES